MLNEQIANRFIGRDKEIDVFIRWLQDPYAPWILHFHDAAQEEGKKGGVGKTWLLRKCAAVAKERYPDIGIVSIDFSDIVDRDRFVIVKRIIEELKTIYPEWSSTSFTQVIEQYSITDYHNITVPESRDAADYIIRDELFTALATDLQKLDKHIEQKKKSLLIFFDSFEAIEENPTIAVLGPFQKFPENYQFKYIGVVIAGRNVLNWMHPNWKGREQEVQVLPVPSFSLKEMVEFINDNRQFPQQLQADSRQAKELYKLTYGRPIAVGLAIDVLKYRDITLERLLTTSLNFNEYLVLKINELENPISWIVLFMAHVYHRFNSEILDWLFEHLMNMQSPIENLDTKNLWKKVLELSFVRRSQYGIDVTLHDEMRQLVTKYNWPLHEQQGPFRQELSNSIVAYYDNKMKEEYNEQRKQIYIIERLYHLLYVDIDDGLADFQQYFQQSIRLWDSPFAHHLLVEAQKFEDRMSSIQKYQLHLAQAKLQSIEKNAKASQYIIYEGLAKLRGIESQPSEASQPKYPETFKIYYSYADEDIELLKQLQKHLAVLKQRNVIIDWHRGKIAPGEEVANKIKHLDTAHFILLCISPDFIDSEYVPIEIARALERHKAKEAKVIPVLFRPTGNWKDAVFGDLQAIPRNSIPVTRWADKDDAFDEIAREIKDLINQLKSEDI